MPPHAAVVARRAGGRRRVEGAAPPGARSLVRLGEWGAAMAARDAAKLAAEQERRAQIPQLWAYYAREELRTKQTGGDKRLRALQDALALADRVGYKRSPDQRKFHRAFTNACLRQIYGADLARNLMRILDENKWTELRSEVLVAVARRGGKTYATAIYGAAYLLTQPGAKICIYSTSRRASRAMLALVYKVYCQLAPNGDTGVATYNQEELSVRGPDGPEDIRTCLAYPSKVRCLRRRRPHPPRRTGRRPPKRRGAERRRCVVLLQNTYFFSFE